jgi:hypothetical protein
MGKIWGKYGEYMGKCEPEVRRWICFLTSEFWWKSSTTLPRRNVPSQARLTGDSRSPRWPKFWACWKHRTGCCGGFPDCAKLGYLHVCAYIYNMCNIPDQKKRLMGWNLPFQNLIWCCTLKAVHGIYPFFNRAYIPVTVDTQFHQLDGYGSKPWYLKYPKIIG